MTSQGSVGGNSSAVASNELVCVVSKDVAMQGTRVPIGVGLVGHVALVGKSVVISDAAKFVIISVLFFVWICFI